MILVVILVPLPSGTTGLIRPMTARRCAGPTQHNPPRQVISLPGLDYQSQPGEAKADAAELVLVKRLATRPGDEGTFVPGAEAVSHAEELPLPGLWRTGREASIRDPNWPAALLTRACRRRGQERGQEYSGINECREEARIRKRCRPRSIFPYRVGATSR